MIFFATILLLWFDRLTTSGKKLANQVMGSWSRLDIIKIKLRYIGIKDSDIFVEANIEE